MNCLVIYLVFNGEKKKVHALFMFLLNLNVHEKFMKI